MILWVARGFRNISIFFYFFSISTRLPQQQHKVLVFKSYFIFFYRYFYYVRNIYMVILSD